MVAGQMVANTKVPEGSWNSETVCVTPWIQTWHWPLSHWEQKPEPGHRPTGGPKVTFPTHFLGILLHSSHIGPEFLQSHQGHAYLGAFALAAPSAWNTLPPNIPMAPSLWIILL